MAAVITYGLMVELAYTADLKSADHLGFAGSSPAGATTGALCSHVRPRGGMADALSSDLSAHEKWVCGFETRRGYYVPLEGGVVFFCSPVNPLALRYWGGCLKGNLRS